jgi:hypothetical protein
VRTTTTNYRGPTGANGKPITGSVRDTTVDLPRQKLTGNKRTAKGSVAYSGPNATGTRQSPNTRYTVNVTQTPAQKRRSQRQSGK